MVKKLSGNTVTCLKRKTKIHLSPSRWLSLVEKAAAAPVKVIKRDGSKRTVMTALAPWGAVCLQDFEWSAQKSMLSILRPFRGKHIWKHCISLLDQNIPITEPYLYLEVKNGPFIIRTYLITRWIEAKNLGETARTRDRISQKKFFEVLKNASSLAANLHSAGFVHGDLKWSNFLWVDAEYPQIFLSDTDHLEKTGAAEKQGKDLARFILSALEFNWGWDTANLLVNWYFERRNVRPVGFEKFLNKQIEKKKKKYENRALNVNSEKAGK